MTTERDHGEIGVRMIRCTLAAPGIYRSHVLAVRAMRMANGREAVSGHGAGIESWIYLTLALMVLGTQTPESPRRSGRAGFVCSFDRAVRVRNAIVHDDLDDVDDKDVDQALDTVETLKKRIDEQAKDD